MQFKGSGPPLSGVDINRVQRLVGAPLPEEYARFLLKHNGGTPMPNCFSQTLEKLGVVWNRVEGFYPVMDTDEHRSNLEWIVKLVRSRKPGEGRLPDNAIMIGHASCGDIVLFVSGPERGQVWLKNWDGFGCPELDQPMAGMTLLATDFDRLLAGLVPDDQMREWSAK